MPYTAENIAAYLEDANRDYYGRRTWSQMFGNLDLARQQAISGLKTDVGAMLGAAYNSAKTTTNAINASGLIQGQRNAALDENELALQDAYKTYMQNYRENVGSINQNISQQYGALNQTLTDQSQMYSKYYQAHFDYLQDLWNKREAGEITTDIFDRFDYSKYLENVHNPDTGEIEYDAEGKPIRMLRNLTSIEDELYDTDPVTRERTLNMAGIRFFEQLENDDALRNVYSFSDYLKANDEELYNWTISSNPYDYAPNLLRESTMAGTFRKMTGRVSSDEQYEGIEKLYGMTEGEINNIFVNVENRLTELNNAYDSGKQGDIDTATENFSAEISKLIRDFGLESDILDDLEKQYGEGYDTIEEFVKAISDDYLNNKASYDQAVKEQDDVYYSMGAVLTGFGAAAGTFIAPGLGTAIGAGIGALLNALITVPASVTGSGTGEAKSKFDTQTKSTKQAYNNLLTVLNSYVINKAENSAREFYQQESVNGGTVSSYNPLTSKHDLYYTYRLNDGKDAEFLSTAEYSADGDIFDWDFASEPNFRVIYNGEDYNLEIGSKTLDTNVVSQLADRVQESLNRPLQSGDIFIYDDHIWIATKDGSVRNVKSQFGQKDQYTKFKSHIQNTRDGARYERPSEWDFFIQSFFTDDK